MRHKILKISIMLLLGINLTSLQAQNMYVKPKTGVQIVYEVNNIQKITFSEGYAVIQTVDSSVFTYILGDLSYFSFQNYSTDIFEDRKSVV